MPINFTITLPKKDNEVTEYLSPEEVESLLSVLEVWPSRDVARMLHLALLTGMRRGEIFALDDTALDFRQELIILKSPKGGKTISIPMSKPAAEVLKEQLEWRKTRYPDSRYVFPGKKGGRRVDCSAVDRVKAEAGISKGFRIFHGLRHHFAVTLANSGEFSLDMIGELLTHKSVAMTKRYGQFLPDTKKKASNRAAELLNGQKGKNSGKIRRIR
jgi:integrase